MSSLRLTYWRAPDLNGVFTLRSSEMRLGRVLFLLRGLGVQAWRHRDTTPYDPILPSLLTIIPATWLNGASSRVHLRSPAQSFPGPVSPDGSVSPWTFTFSFTRLCYLCRCEGGNQYGHVSGSFLTTHSGATSCRTQCRAIVPHGSATASPPQCGLFYAPGG